ncbi:MAG: hypothetical protein RBU27_08300 [Bacteroidota bacterium]|jgi:hypothetical protein|nr:hypothetical protein [Bacteroidota bacterium]
MSTFETSLSDGNGCHVTLFHDPDDPLSWIIRKWKRGLFGRRCELSRWFATREQAEQFAGALIRECSGGRRRAATVA